MTDVKVKKIKAIIGLHQFREAVVRDMLNSSLKGLQAHTEIYSKLPIDLNTYGTDIAAFEASIPAAIDGSKTAVALKNKLKDVAIREYVQLAHYVEAACNGDVATFLLSGFEAAPTNKTPAGPAGTPSIDSAVPGSMTGQMKVTFTPGDNALVHDLRFGPVPAGGGVPTTWTELRLGSSKPAIVENLMPGTAYTFQVRAQDRVALTGWSDPVTRFAV